MGKSMFGWKRKTKKQEQPTMEEGLLWWLEEGTLAGMARPSEEELPALFAMGFRGIVSLLEEPPPVSLYESIGLRHLWVPTPDGGVPGREACLAFVDFVEQCKREGLPVVVHCMAGWGRTGTMLGAYLVASRCSAEEAIAQVRHRQPHAIQTTEQEDFLYALERVV
jgi:atypical dual specificity phosphatase